MRSLVVIATLLWGAAAFAEQPLPIYPGTVHTRIGNDLVIGGELYRLAYFTTTDPIPKVAEYFYKFYSEQGYPTFVDGVPEQDEVIVTAFYTREGLARSVVLKGHDGKTLGFSAIKDLWTKVEDDSSSAKSAMVPLEGTLISEDLAHDDGQGHARQRTQLVQGTLEGVREDLLKRMNAKGFTLGNETGTNLSGKKAIVLELNRPGEQVITSLSAVGDGVIGVYQTWIGSDRPDAVPNDSAVQKLRQQIAREKAQEGQK